MDLKVQAKLISPIKVLQQPELETIKGVGRASYLPSLGRLGDDDELDTVLQATTTEVARTCRALRADRPLLKKNGEPNSIKRVPKGATVYFHANIPPHIVLALIRGGPDRRNLKDPTDALNGNLVRMKEVTETEYGVRVVASIRHPPNPYSYTRWEALGWYIPIKRRASIPEKGGGWNLHNQVYCSRVTDGVFTCENRRFSYLGDMMVASYWLREYGVDIHAADRATHFKRFTEDFEGGRKRLPLHLARQVLAGEITRTEACSAAVENAMARWDAKWANSEGSKNASERLDYILKAKSRTQKPIDWYISIESSADIERRLIETDPLYGPLLQECRLIWKELKERHIACGYKRTLNDLYADFELDEQARVDQQRKKDEEKMNQETLDAAVRAEAHRQEAQRAELEAERDALAAETEVLAAREKALSDEAEWHRDELLRIRAENVALSDAEQARASMTEEALRAVEGQQQKITELQMANLALVTAAERRDPIAIRYSPEFLIASLREANMHIAAGRDLSLMSARAKEVVGIIPQTRIRRITVMVQGRKELPAVLGPHGKPVEEPHPSAGKATLLVSILRYVRTVVTALERSSADGSATAADMDLLKGYNEVLAAHTASIAIEKVDWATFDQEMGRIVSGIRKPGDEYFLEPIYLVMAREAAEAGNRQAASYLSYRLEFERRQAEPVVQAPGPKVSANDLEPRGR
jgi:hypothetical protein